CCSPAAKKLQLLRRTFAAIRTLRVAAAHFRNTRPSDALASILSKDRDSKRHTARLACRAVKGGGDVPTAFRCVEPGGRGSRRRLRSPILRRAQARHGTAR